MELAQPDHFECFHCHKIFQGRVYEVVRERSRLHFDGRVPHVESDNFCGLECYCSRSCLDARVDRVMAREHVPATYPGRSRIANCAICHASVDRTAYHFAYLATLSEPIDEITWDTVELDYLAVLCETCSTSTDRSNEDDLLMNFPSPK
jgi:hypothetical protein